MVMDKANAGCVVQLRSRHDNGWAVTVVGAKLLQHVIPFPDGDRVYTLRASVDLRNLGILVLLTDSMLSLLVSYAVLHGG